MIIYDRFNLGTNVRDTMEGGHSRVTLDTFKSWLISAGVNDTYINSFLDYLADEENVFEEDYGSRRFAAEWFDLWSEFEEGIEDELEESKKKITEAVEDYIHPRLKTFAEYVPAVYYACYTLTAEGYEEDHFGDFDLFEDAISACKQKTNETHLATHACVIVEDEQDDEAREFMRSYRLSNYEVVAEFSPDAEDEEGDWEPIEEAKSRKTLKESFVEAISLSSLADLIYAYGNDLRVLHLNVKGEGFKSVHEALNELYDNVFDAYDTVAELAIARGEEVKNPSTVVSIIKPLEARTFNCEEAIVIARDEGLKILDAVCSIEGYDKAVQPALDNIIVSLDKTLNYVFARWTVAVDAEDFDNDEFKAVAKDVIKNDYFEEDDFPED